MQGNCGTDPDEEFLANVNSEVPILPRKPGVCMLLAPHNVLYHRSTELWLENLYIRVSRNETTVVEPLSLLTVSDPTFNSRLWLTDSMLQGDGGASVTGLTVTSRAVARGALVPACCKPLPSRSPHQWFPHR